MARCLIILTTIKNLFFRYITVKEIAPKEFSIQKSGPVLNIIFVRETGPGFVKIGQIMPGTGKVVVRPGGIVLKNPAIVGKPMCIRADGLNKPRLFVLIHRCMLLTDTGENPGFIRC